jgi:phosphoribosylanthranilate isomerase
VIPRVKICGVTRFEDAALAVSLGASAIGFIFWPQSPRYVAPARVRTIIADLPPFVSTVGVFVNESPERVAEVVREAGVTVVQLHGQEDVIDYEGLPWPLIKAVVVRGGVRPPELMEIPVRIPVLLDAFDPARPGGTGRSIDWQVAASVAVERPVILSGGLRADNVADAIEAVAPMAVDVSSGVEREPGIKDPAKLRAFFEALQAGELR